MRWPFVDFSGVFKPELSRMTVHLPFVDFSGVFKPEMSRVTVHLPFVDFSGVSKPEMSPLTLANVFKKSSLSSPSRTSTPLTPVAFQIGSPLVFPTYSVTTLRYTMLLSNNYRTSNALKKQDSVTT